jgi:hypothetical protein
MYSFIEKACCFAGIWYYSTISLASTKYFRALVCIPPMYNDPNIQLFFPCRMWEYAGMLLNIHLVLK